MKLKSIPAIVSLLALLAVAIAQDAPRERGQGGAGQGGQVEPALVPPYLFNAWLCRPGADSITISVMAWEQMDVFASYGADAKSLTQKSGPITLVAGESQNIVLTGLKPDTRYAYQLTAKTTSGDPLPDSVRSFHTQRSVGSTFTFTIQADSHLDNNTNVKVYQQTLANMLAAKPDFMIDLGDTTMVDKFGRFYTRAESQYRAQRYYMGQIAHSTPIFLALGNHDGESAERLDGGADSMPFWSLANRKKYFPNPEPGGIYTGNTKPSEFGGLLQNYYAWEWGSAQFIVLDPFWETKRDGGGNDNWSRTLGEAQYRWLTKTLEESKAPLRFVFLHHLVGGTGRDVRGGIVNVPYLEWGGKNLDGSEGFAQHRPGWALPLHPLFVKHDVSIVFHGHDHMYAMEEADGIIYQEVPQPGHPRGGTRSAEEYGYKGVIKDGSGHVRVTVKAQSADIEYVGSTVSGVTQSADPNGMVLHRYTVGKQ
jgi:predicted phosphodiesterase